MIIDAHTHLGLESFIVKEIPAWKKAKPSFAVKMENRIDALISSMERAGVTRSVTFPFPLEEVDSEAANSYVLDESLEYSDRIIPFVLIDPEPERWIERGARGFKQHFLLAPERYDQRSIYPILEKHRRPLLAHLSTGKASQEVREILKSAPGLQLIIAHMGRQVPNTGEGVEELVKEFKSETNVFFETSTVWDPGVIHRAVEIVGDERILFGSDFPFNGDVRDDTVRYEIGVIEESTGIREQRENLLGKNIERILEVGEEK